ncbi:MAG: nickel-responsive transcriptional regulator NikR [Helicobacteraceae bacterium]|jgi:CopG family nickel-responsive transcriptional regulator|nr:nickel-responsive transcriptional regulator NikR [Helicobacteraceae bacterium]
MSEMIRFSVSLPKALLDALDKTIIAKGYDSRSEFVRDFIREQITAEKWEDEKAEVFGNLTMIYDHRQRELNAKMIELAHNSTSNVLCSTHVHIDHCNCMESIILKGFPDEIETVATQIGGLRGVRFAKLTRVSRLEH